jgi:signal transduction histidine kinase
MTFRLDTANYLLFTSFVINFSLALIIYSGSRKNRINQVYTIIVLNVAAWCLGMFMYRGVQSSELAIFWAKFYYVATAIVPVSLLYFAYLFPKKKIFINKWLDLFLLVIALFFIVSPFLGGSIIVNVIPHSNMEDEIFFGSMLNAWGVYLISYFVLAFFLLFKKYRQSTGIEKLQIGYVSVGSFLSIFIGMITNHVFPLYFHNPNYAWIGPFGTIIMVIFVSYSALKHHLFSIKIIATELFTFAVMMALLTKVFSSQGPELVLNIGIFLSVAVFGSLLIKSVINEVEQRKKIEKLAQDVKKAYEIEKYDKEQIEKMAKEVERAYVVEKHAKEQTEKAYDLEKKANEELKKIDEYKNSFIRQTQHDLRTPLTIMMGYSDMLLGGYYGKMSKKAVDILKRMQSVTQEKLKDINNFLDLEQFKLGKGVVSLKPGIELPPLLDEIINVLSPKAELKGIYVKLEKPLDKSPDGQEKPFAVPADREKLKSAIFNIIDNAIKYTVKGGVIVAVATNHKSLPVQADQNTNDQISKPTILITVKDTGIGIPKDKIKNIFEEQFERTKRAEKIAPGSGIGLYLSNQIIKLHKGKVWIESEGEDKGSTFYIELPAE